MLEFDNLPALLQAMQDYIMREGLTLPTFTRAKAVEALGASNPLVRVIDFGEALYAVRDTLPNEGRTMAAQAVAFATYHCGAQDLLTDDRGNLIVRTLRNLNGEKIKAPLEPPASLSRMTEVTDDKLAPSQA